MSPLGFGVYSFPQYGVSGIPCLDNYKLLPRSLCSPGIDKRGVLRARGLSAGELQLSIIVNRSATGPGELKCHFCMCSWRVGTFNTSIVQHPPPPQLLVKTPPRLMRLLPCSHVRPEFIGVRANAPFMRVYRCALKRYVCRAVRKRNVYLNQRTHCTTPDLCCLSRLTM